MKLPALTQAHLSKLWWLPGSLIVIASLVIAHSMVSHKPKPQPVGSPLASACPGTKANDFDCIRSHYQALTLNSGSAAAFADLRVAYENNEFVRTQCHQVTHVIGRAAVTKYKDLAEVYSNGDAF